MNGMSGFLLVIVAGMLFYSLFVNEPTPAQPAGAAPTVQLAGASFEDRGAQLGSGGQFTPNEPQDWSAFPFVARAQQGNEGSSWLSNTENKFIIYGADAAGQFSRAREYTLGVGGPGGLPIDPSPLADNEVRISLLRGWTIGAVNISNAEYNTGVRTLLQGLGTVPWAVVNAHGEIIGGGTSAPTDPNFCDGLMTNRTCMVYDGQRAHAINVDLLY